MGMLNERDYMAQTVETLAPLVEGAVSGRTQVAFKFRQATRGEQDDTEPTIDRLRDAIAEFDELPAEQQNAICNGWDARGITDPPHSHEFLESTASAAVKRLLEVTPALASMIWQPDDCSSPVSVRIAFGTSKSEALKHLRDIEKAIRDHYHTLISGDTASIVDLDAETDRRVQAQAAGREGKAA
ncbi:MAG: hypothetical protein ACTHM6_14885 [Tepidisphaeraceae bacterium]